MRPRCAVFIGDSSACWHPLQHRDGFCLASRPESLEQRGKARER